MTCCVCVITSIFLNIEAICKSEISGVEIRKLLFPCIGKRLPQRNIATIPVDDSSVYFHFENSAKVFLRLSKPFMDMAE